ncbi:hypothetical protein STSP2_01411 [Anaerohalosphaera lusitana]|uniref:Uncharacterized protein n=1 Tax=Anaerohalosphaera lusitana TaxID=1936003 RepID=A0A1U9NKA9_9BACT|nr:hypothetical protein [Anaerohalosphaera lusitana]AQT68255.1 hypothetical protein STSP2_01411 [Anaerohalosphaera lusitana]
MSTAVGLLQITRSTYNDYYDRGIFPQNDLWKTNFGEVWDESNLVNPARNMVAGLFVLQGKPGTTLQEKLGNYYGKGNNSNRAYSGKILKGARFVKDFLERKDLRHLSPQECSTLMRELDDIVH